MKVRLFISFVLTFCLCFNLFAKQEEEDAPLEYVYKNEANGGIRLQTNGYGFYGEKAKFITYKLRRVFQGEFLFYKNPREQKQTPRAGNPNSTTRDYIYGKQNSFFVFRGVFGYKKMIADKAERAGVRLSMNYMLGGNLGILKPYKVNAIYPINDQPGSEEIRVIGFDDDPEVFLDRNRITGFAGARHGFNELKIRPGVHGKLGLDFDWAGHDEFVKSLEVGISVDVYPTKIPIIVQNSDTPIFLGMYLGFKLGRRW